MVIYGAPVTSLFSSLFAEFLRVRAGDAAATGPPATPIAAKLPFFDSLTKTESAPLRYFQTHKHEVVSPEQLLADVWKRPNASPRRARGDPPPAPASRRGLTASRRHRERARRGYRYVPARAER